ncbi:MAG: threonine synthase, partial [Deltaproteobacteria bacterium]|nr:threonine synthase [Deltaproteobacteria bacterium]
MSPSKPRPRAWFQSLHHADDRYDLDEVVYTDREGGLLQVVHDMGELAKTSAEEWRQLFEKRARRNEWPFGSGVWGKKEWVLPDIDNDNVVSMYEGHTNLFWAERYGREIGLEELWIKL